MQKIFLLSIIFLGNFVQCFSAAYNQHAYYLQTLSFFSAKLKNPELRQSLLAAKTAQEAYFLLLEQKGISSREQVAGSN